MPESPETIRSRARNLFRLHGMEHLLIAFIEEFGMEATFDALAEIVKNNGESVEHLKKCGAAVSQSDVAAYTKLAEKLEEMADKAKDLFYERR